MEPARDAWEMLTHGFQLSSMLQAYSALPFNITSGVTTIQGTAGRPVVDGEFIPRNAGVGSDFFSMSLRVSRSFRIVGRVRVEGLAEVFNLTNRHEQPHEEHELRIGGVPDESLADVQSDHRGRGSPDVAVRSACEVLKRMPCHDLITMSAKTMMTTKKNRNRSSRSLRASRSS